MSGEQEATYEIGYKKPPKATRFQKGKSGYPKGRPKKSVESFDPGKILQAIDNEEIVVVVDGKRKRMLKAEVDLQQSFTRAISGDLPVARLVAQRAFKHFRPEDEGPSGTQFLVMPNEYFDSDDDKVRKKVKGRLIIPGGQYSRRDNRLISAGTIFRRVAQELVPVKVDGRKVLMSRWQLFLRQIYTMALNKNNAAIRLLDKIRTQFPGEVLPGAPITFIIDENDADL